MDATERSKLLPIAICVCLVAQISFNNLASAQTEESRISRSDCGVSALRQESVVLPGAASWQKALKHVEAEAQRYSGSITGRKKSQIWSCRACGSETQLAIRTA